MKKRIYGSLSKMASDLELLKSASEIYEKQFGKRHTVAVRAPGRVNLIGEHTDYNDGLVFPMAINCSTVIIGSVNEENECHVFTTSKNIDGSNSATFLPQTPTTPLKPGDPKWCNYVKGVVALYPGQVLPFNAVVCSSVPLGGGLSSSASLEIATYLFLEALEGNVTSCDLKKKALICQKAEHDFAGVPCGIMDQFISMMGKEKHAMLLDCRSMEIEHIPIISEDIAFLISNTNVSHQLSGSEYAVRKAQCQEAAKILGKESLRDVTMNELEAKQTCMDNVIYRRAKHVISEIERTISAANILKNQDYIEFGKLMVQSHISLRDDYQVSCKELDLLVDLALKVDGVYGSRMTGGGFGGCTVTLLRKDAVEKTISHIQNGYDNKATIFISTPCEGASVL